MMRPVRYMSVACLALALTGCASAPIHFYTLVPPASAPPATSAAAPYRISVLPVPIPAQVDQPQIIVRQGQGSMALLENRQWIAPLGDEIHTVISDEMSKQLHTQDVYGLAANQEVPTYRVHLDVKRFESVPSQYTLLAATWSIDVTGKHDGKTPSLECTSTIRESVGQGYDALVAGHQQGLTALADAMARGVRIMARGGAPHCPR